MSHHKIILGDCLEGLGLVDDESVDLVFADSPFNVGKKYGTPDRYDDYYTWCYGWIELCFEALKPSGSFYLMTISHHLPELLPIMSRFGDFVNLIMWRNVSATQGPKGFWKSYQPILLYAKDTSSMKFHRYAQTRHIPKKSRRWGGYSTEPKGQLLDYWDDIPFVYAGSITHDEAVLEPGTNRKAHPTQMPEDLARRTILFSTDEGDTVLDPFAGTFTVSKVAKEKNSNSISIEINPDYWENIGRKRLNADIPTLDNSVSFEVINLQEHPP